MPHKLIPNRQWSWCALLTLATAAGCQSISGVHGWDGPPLEMHVTTQGGELVMVAPTGGWTLTLDQVQRQANGATLWVTAHRPQGISTQALTPVRLHWSPDDGAMPQCINAQVRIDEGDWVPAVEGCR